MVETSKNQNYDNEIYKNEVYDNYFINLRQWLETARGKEQTYMRECLSSIPPIGILLNSEVNNNGIK